jgi:hypothetical protein
MPATALAHQPDTETAPQPVKERPLSKRLRKALHLLETGECSTQRAAAERAGMSEFQLSRRLREPQIQAFIARKRSENISVASIRASAKAMKLIDSESDHVAAKMTLALMAHTGDIKGDSSQVSVNVGVSVGYVIDLSGTASNPSATTIDARVTHHDE